MFSDTAECDKLSPGDQAKFEVELHATSCDNINGVVEETLEVYPTGLTESLQITAQIDCSCQCDDMVRYVNYNYCFDVLKNLYSNFKTINNAIIMMEKL